MNGSKHAFVDPKNLTTKEKQELLVLLGFNIDIDGIYGPCTKHAEKAAQDYYNKCFSDMKEHPAWFTPLVLKFVQADFLGDYNNILPDVRMNTFSDVVREMATYYANIQPSVCEVGGNNKGPWVRFFCEEGDVWCALFACGTVLEQAEQWWLGAGKTLPHHKGHYNTGWTPTIAARAKELGKLYEVNELSRLKPGHLFLSERDTGDPVIGKRIGHVGIVVEVLEDGAFKTVEGNARASGEGRDGVIYKLRNAHTQKYYFVDLS
jgi:hypothetical protein